MNRRAAAVRGGVFLLLLTLVLALAACGSDAKPSFASGVTGQSSTSAPAVAKQSGPNCDKAVNWDKALDHVGETVTVRGTVVDASYARSSNGSPTFLNLGKPYPDPARFTIVVWGSERARFTPSPEELYRGKSVCVYGLVQLYRGGAEIILKSPSEITVAK